ncbi:MAG: ChrR family anti-sigma-E factor [Cellvibrionales bacterium]|nr:ChrR family anti-sigma-E factor [Cellvibrionales bacterium]
MKHNNSHHHPDSLTLTAFAAGSIDTYEGLCIATHIENCPECKRHMKQLELVGASILTEAKDSFVASDVKNKTLDAIKQAPQGTPQPTKKHQARNTDVPKVLTKWIPEGFGQLEWVKVNRQLATYDLTANKRGPRVSLVKVSAGGQMPHHRHSGKEITVILQGSFSDEDGIYTEGDYLVRESHENHSPVASLDKDCICLTLLDGPIELTGFFSKLLNPWLRLRHPI